MLRGFAFLLIGLGFGGAIGFVIGASETEAPVRTPVMEEMEHSHVHGDPLTIEPGPQTPEVAISLFADPV